MQPATTIEKKKSRFKGFAIPNISAKKLSKLGKRDITKTHNPSVNHNSEYRSRITPFLITLREIPRKKIPAANPKK
jgi:hypothetical protein